MKPIVRLSVRAVVETTLFEPDLLPAAGIMERMRQGTQAHLARQEAGRKAEASYEAEVPLEAKYETDELCLRITGRADALFLDGDLQVIEELKLGTVENPLNPAHMAQAEIYGYMLCESRNLSQVRLMVRYVDTDGQVLKDYSEDKCSAELKTRFDSLCRPAADIAVRRLQRQTARNLSIETLRFPFPTYRAGQKAFSTAVYAAVRDRKRLFIQAPTGIGKTMAAVYPVVHALRQDKCAAILFLTARGTGRRAAVEAAVRLTEAGTLLYVVEITAKAKACPYETQDCRPDICSRAAGFYTRLPSALAEAEQGGIWDAASISALAQKHVLCPFELSLEMAKQADLIICDYNYAYDPAVSIDELLSRRGGAALLVDEAHRLCDRVRDDYSVWLRLPEIKELRRVLGKLSGRKSALYMALTRVIDAVRQVDAGQMTSGIADRQSAFVLQENKEDSGASHPWDGVSLAMEGLLEAAAKALQNGRSAETADALGLAMDWLSAAKRYSDRYAFLTEGTGEQKEIGLYLMDPAPEIFEVSRRARGAVYFSATLAPLDGTMRLLGSEPGDLRLVLPSPFSPESLSVDILPLDVRYQARERNAGRLAQALESFLDAHPGNTMVFFPSYAFMEMTVEYLPSRTIISGRQLLFEVRSMSEQDRAAFLDRFVHSDDTGVVLLCVLGGSFAEGIDLPGSQLQNVAIISTGLPTADARIRVMQNYYRTRGEDGFFYTMTLPGMIRVIQAAGRLIRTETDTGSLLLIDSRYNDRTIRALLDATLIGAALGQEKKRNA
ncbi:MAG: hypothetical protein IJ242_05020 [Clostridia bacterium]|nr:hypothetical protein [Clostridia bacterium]